MATLSFRALRGDTRTVPVELRSNFRHLYLDILWYGVLAGSAISFLTVYATRIGADSFQIGFLAAGPAVINLVFTLPTGRWLESRPIGPAVFWSSVFHRFFYLIWVVIPWLLLPHVQLWLYIAITLMMTIPGTVLAVGFNALFADAVPAEWRGHVTGVRNAVLSVAFIVASLVSGVILERLPFPTGYQIVFAIGTNANPIIGQTSKLRLNKRGYIDTDKNLATSMAGVFAGGDIVTGAATVIEAMGAGRKAARSMKNYLRIRDTEADNVGKAGIDAFFGIDLRERNFARIRAA